MTDLADIADPRLQRLYDYWRAARRGRPMPARKDLDPLEFGYLLGHVSLIDVLRDPLRFRVRLHGTAMAARIHYDLTGKLLADLPDTDLRAYLLERCRQLVDDAAPMRIEHEREFEGRIHHYEALWLPLSDDAATVTMLMLALVYRPDRAVDMAAVVARAARR